jgi:hypothetical protein
MEANADDLVAQEAAARDYQPQFQVNETLDPAFLHSR